MTAIPSEFSTWRLQIARTSVDGRCRFRLDGRLGIRASGDLIEAVMAAIEAGERHIVLDLSGVDYASSAGLTALDAIAGGISVAGGSLVLCGLAEPVRLVFDLAGLASQFVIESEPSPAAPQLG